jgi:transposase
VPNECEGKSSSSTESPRQKKANLPGENGIRASASDASIPSAFPELPSPPPSSLPCTRLTDAERTQLLEWTRARTSPHRLVVRSRIILLAHEGLTTGEIAARLDVSPATVRLWCRRFNAIGVAALERDRPGRGRPRGMSAPTVLAVLRTMRAQSDDAPRWTTRALSSASGASLASVWRIWKRYGLGPHSRRSEIERAIAQAISETPAAAK